MALPGAAVELTDDQISQLLAEAEERLAAKQSTLVPSKQDKDLKVKNPAEGKMKAPAAEAGKADRDLEIRVPRPRLPKKEFKEAAEANAGPGWYNMPKTELTDQLRKDLQILKMRDVLDPKRHYRKDNSRLAVPKYSQVGTMVEGPTEFYSARMTKKERKRTLLEEVLQTEDTTRRFKSKYGEIQKAKTSGKKGHYKKMMQKRYGKK